MPADNATDTAPMIARAVPCRHCRGAGAVRALSCPSCRFARRVGFQGRDGRERWYPPAALHGLAAFPHCGHTLIGWFPNYGALVGYPDCRRCEGTGEVTERRTGAAWARKDAREARRRKQGASAACLAVTQNAALLGYSRRAVRELLKRLAPPCEARCKATGTPCARRVVLGRMRCKSHGGASTGPRTEEGRARCRAAAREQARIRRGRQPETN